jgi:hypothetical protein
MTADMPDRFQHRLLEGLLDEHATLTAAAPSAPPAAPRPARRPRRYRAGLLVGAPLLVGAAVAAVALGRHSAPLPATHHQPGTVAASSGAGRVVAGGQRTVPAHHTVSYVVHRMAVAADANDAVVHQFDRAPDSQTGARTRMEIWSQHGNDTSLLISRDAAGRPVTGYLRTDSAHAITTTTIDYRSHRYSTHSYAPAPAGGPGPAKQTLAQGASDLRHQVATGQAKLIGTTTVDGVRALELRSTGRDGTELTYVDPSTYLVIRDVSMPPGATPASAQTITEDYTYLPDTAANQAHLTPGGAIPPGFHRVR